MLRSCQLHTPGFNPSPRCCIYSGPCEGFAPAKSREICPCEIARARNRARFRVRNRAKFRVAQTGHFIEFRANRTLYRFTQNSDTLLGFARTP
eukprot:COSAG06_NODE_316_length_17668_cov_19.142410_7_plen_93_part_00